MKTIIKINRFRKLVLNMTRVYFDTKYGEFSCCVDSDSVNETMKSVEVNIVQKHNNEYTTIRLYDLNEDKNVLTEVNDLLIVHCRDI